MELTENERKILVEALIFALAADACMESEKFDQRTALKLATHLNDPSFDLDCYMYKGRDGEYYDEISQDVVDQIPQIKVDNG